VCPLDASQPKIVVHCCIFCNKTLLVEDLIVVKKISFIEFK
jgi:hypothetical protein